VYTFSAFSVGFLCRIGFDPLFSVSDVVLGLESGQQYDVVVLSATRVGFPAVHEDDWLWVTHTVTGSTPKRKSPPLITVIIIVVCRATVMIRTQAMCDKQK